MRLIRNVLTSLCLAVVASSALSQEFPKVNVGVILPMTGPQAPFGKEAMRGIELALEQLKADEPKIAGYFKLVKADDMSSVDNAAKVAETLLNQNRVHLILGTISGSGTDAIAAVARKEKRPVVSPIATAHGLTDEGFVFRTCFSSRFQGSLLAAFALKDLNQKSVAILRDDTEESKSFAETFKKTFGKGGGKIAKEIVYPYGTSDFAPQIKDLTSSKASVVLLPAFYQEAAMIMKQAQVAEQKFTFLGGDSWETPSLAQIAGSAAQGHYFSAHFAADSSDPDVQKFVEAFSKKYGRPPGAIAALSYDGFNLIVDVVKRARTVLKKPLYKAFIRTRDFKGVTGMVSLKNSGDSVKSAIIKQTMAEGSKFKAEVKPRMKQKGH